MGRNSEFKREVTQEVLLERPSKNWSCINARSEARGSQKHPACGKPLLNVKRSCTVSRKRSHNSLLNIEKQHCVESLKVVEGMSDMENADHDAMAKDEKVQNEVNPYEDTVCSGSVHQVSIHYNTGVYEGL